MMSMRFERPFFITPHAVKRFQERVADLPAADIIQLIQSILQDPGLPVDMEYRDSQMSPVFRGQYGAKAFYIPVIKREGPWPSVPTIYGEESVIHGKYVRGELNCHHKKRGGKKNGKQTL